MELQVAPPLPPADFISDSNCSSPNYTTAPSSPHLFPTFFFSAPASPSSSLRNPTPPTFPDAAGAGNNTDFEFDFSGHLQRTSLSADELFDGGKIRPLKPPPSPPLKSAQGLESSSSTRSKGKKIVQEQRDFDFDSFVKSRKVEERVEEEQQKRGRSGRASSFSCSSTSSGRKGISRSVPPFRNSNADDVSDQDFSQAAKAISSSTSNNTKSSHASFLSSLSFTKGYSKWRLKDFLLFRSASEGRAAGKDPLRKYTVLSKKVEEEVRNSSFRSTESFGSVSSRRRGPVSAHELHYTVNRAASEEMKKKTVLPYKQLGPLGCLGFNPSLHQIAG
ncbi:uncharacterized protein LOC129292709 [Prosopis cineraria]|uniref:uncharacterized protein LOC129292709 n=1 Tax=Prosopis cineraria TaxID=364024 RepID=UPI0024100CE0|nr:uncharacterized protein LOC129292709 [Prosopis cineraria]